MGPRNHRRIQSSAVTSGGTIDWGPLSVAFVWGLNAVAQKFLLRTLSPSALQSVRYGCVSLLLLGAMWWMGRRVGKVLKGDFVSLLGAGLLIGVQLLIFIHALNLTTASEATVIISTAPVWTAVLTAIMGLEILYLRNWLGIVAALGGVSLVILGGAATPAAHAPARVAGDMTMLGAAFLYALYMVISKRLMNRHGTLAVITLSLCIANLVFLPAGLSQAMAVPWLTLSGLEWFCLAYGILLAGVYGFVMWYRSIKLTTPARTAVYQYLVPVFAVLAAALFLHEKLAGYQFVGIAVTLGGVYLARYRRPESQLIA